MIVLGVETSCDETSAALVDLTADRVKVLKPAGANVTEKQAR